MGKKRKVLIEKDSVIEEVEQQTAPTYTKRIRKGPVTFHLKLTEEQKEAKEKALGSILTIFTGAPGTSKSLLAANIALDLLIKGHVDQIILTRPTVVSGSDIGFLPGEGFSLTSGKLAPFLSPMIQNMKKLRCGDEIDKMIKDEKIIVIPLQYLRGFTFENKAVIGEEMQNATAEDFKLLTSRIGLNSSMLLTMDYRQIDLKRKSDSIALSVEKIKDLEGVSIIELTQNFRHPLAIQIGEILEKD